MPQDDVVCVVTVDPANEASASTTKLAFTPQAGLAQLEASVTISGVPDWKDDGDAVYTVRLGPCTSADARFNGIGFPQQPSVTSYRLLNQGVPFPIVTAVVPSSILRSGRSVTVHGSNFGPDARVHFCNSVLGLPSPSVARKWVWVHNNATGRDVPIKRAQLALLAHALVGDNLDRISIDEPGLNSTLCDAMVQEGFEISNCAGGDLDLEQNVDFELSALLQFHTLNESVFAFTTPCLNTTVRRCMLCYRL